MYATAHRVSSPQGMKGINTFLHEHGTAFPWPEDPSPLPETDPGLPLWNNGPEIRPGGNRVHSSLDVLAPDLVHAEEIEDALTGLWLQLVLDEAGPPPGQNPLPNPVVFRLGNVVLRFGVEPSELGNRAGEMAELRRALDPAMAQWFAIRQRGK